MPCFHPRQGYWSKTVNPSGKRSIVHNAKEAFHDLPIDYACGQCQGCRGQRALDWATRIHHEQQLNEANCFVTLTYNDKFLPRGGTLNFEHHQLFMKRLRRKFAPRPIRYYTCGEYGDKSLRPHFHACLFNFDLNDKEKWGNKGGGDLYISPTLNSIWEHGNAVIGSLTFASAAYVARYILKKITGPQAASHYQVVDPVTGEYLWDVEPEASRMSQGIGIPWLEKYWRDVYPHDFFHINGKKVRPPPAYDRWLEKNHPAMFAEVKARRQVGGEQHAANNTHERLRIREELAAIKSEYYRRIYEV